jgi:pimeloyl-ACP methyl ester carboxylesterase
MFGLLYQHHTFKTPDGAVLHTLTMGNGPIPLVVIPGAGDGNDTLDKTAWRLGLYFRGRVRQFSLLVVSRRQPLPADFGLERHADDFIGLIDRLGWGPSIWECNSGGGPIGQLIAARRPDLVKGLILSSTLHRSNATTGSILSHWIELAQRGLWAEFQWSSIELTFRPQTVKRYRLARPLLGLIAPPPRDPNRIIHTLQELLDFNHRLILPRIVCPVLVTGGEDDRIIPATIQREMALLIPGCQLKLYPSYGHGNDQENPEYEQEVRKFAQSSFEGEIDLRL